MFNVNTDLLIVALTVLAVVIVLSIRRKPHDPMQPLDAVKASDAQEIVVHNQITNVRWMIHN